MRRTTVAIVVLCIWLPAADASAQTALKKLADIIRSQRATADGDAQAPDGASGPISAFPGPADDMAQQPGYLGLVADDREDRGRGVRILEVMPGGPAEKAGLKVDDLITSLGGIRVRQMDEAVAILQQMLPGDVLDVEVLRGESSSKFQVTFSQRPVEPLAAVPSVQPVELVEPRSTGRPILDLIPAIPRLLQQPSGPSPSVEALINRLQARIDELERRVQQLERAVSEKQQSGPKVHLVQPDKQDKQQ